MTPPHHLSSEQLDLYELGSLDATARAEAQAHLEGCRACTARLETLRTDAAHFRQYVQPRTQAAISRAPGRQRWSLRWPALGLTAAAAVLVGVFATRFLGAGTTDPVDAYVGIRGEAVFGVVVARGGAQAEPLPDEPLRPGDRLRFRVDGAGASHVLVVSRDPAGAWSVYAPFGGEVSQPIAPGAQFLPGAVELDDTLGREHLIAVFSRTPLKAAEVLAALKDRALPTRPSTLQDVPGAQSVQVLPVEKR